MDIPARMDRAATPPTTTARPGHWAWIGLGVMVLLGFVSYLDRQIISLMVIPIEHDLKISDTQIGLLQGAAFGLVYPVVAIPMGYAADRFSRRWVIFCCVMFWAVSAMASGLAVTFGALFAARVGVGLGEAAVVPAIASLLSDIFPKRKLATVFSIYSSGVLLGGGGALWIGGAILEWAKAGMTVPGLGHLASWQIAFLLTGAPAAILAFLVFLVREPPRPAAQPGAAAHAPWSEVFSFIRRTWLFLGCYVIGQTCLLVLSTGGSAWLPAVMQRSYGWNMAQIGSTLAVFVVLFGFPGQMTNGLVVDRMFRRQDDAHLRYYMYAAILIMLSGMLAPLAPTALAYLAAMGPSKFLLNFAGVFIAALQVVTPSRLRGRVNALCGIITGTLGYTLGPSIVALFTDGVFHDQSKVIWSLALTAAVAAPAAAAAFAIALKPMREAVAKDRSASGVSERAAPLVSE